ncbi:hypothetical protein FPZ12_013565 [Amycolatopsis acidicola]|uniref:Uncharacterized protein n=1 Tax=Amycolatopsis acidicola TaxID=2596893 RepID=A0A5N0V9W9_9PSEU|nr:hypothetical protein FPZ12_013565 [Amycolatopsis acidicola]
MAKVGALMGLSAARALNVAVQLHRQPLRPTDRDAVIHFVRRDVGRLDVQRHPTDLDRGGRATCRTDPALLRRESRPAACSHRSR